MRVVAPKSSPERGGGPRREAPWWWGRSEAADPSTGFAGPPPRSGEEY